MKQQLLKGFRKLEDIVTVINGILLIGIVILIVVQVACRKAGISLAGTEELARFSYVVYTFLAWPIACLYTGALMPVLASIECFRMAMEPGFYDEIEHKANLLYDGINELFRKHGIPGHCRGMGARFGIYFGVEDSETDFNWRAVKQAYDLKRARMFVKEALDSGMYFVDPGNGPQPPHCGFSIQHTDSDLNDALDRMDRIFAKIK